MSDLVAIAECAWRVRTVLCLALPAIAAADNPVLTRNIVDALNDMSACMPLSEDGPDWRRCESVLHATSGRCPNDATVELASGHWVCAHHARVKP